MPYKYTQIHFNIEIHMQLKSTIIGLLLFSATTTAVPFITQDDTKDNQSIFGLIEKIVLLPDNLSMNAKMDTGALTSSLDAKNIELFSKNSSNWVRFDVLTQDNDNNQKTATFEREIIRTVYLRGAGGSDKRPAILMKICIGNRMSEEQFTLRDRSEMKYPVIIGRKTIEHLGLIDVKKQFTVEPRCIN